MYTTKSDTFGRLIEDWIEAGADGLKETTRAAYATVTQAHIFPALGEMPTADVTAEHVSTLMCSKTDTLAPATMRIIAAVLRGALQFAQVEGSVSEECASAITATRSSRRTEVRSLSRTEQAALEKVLVGTDPSRLGVLLTLYTGLRIGELCALRWGDLSLEDRTVRVSRCVQRIRRRSGGKTKTELYFGSPKSINSARCIPMPSKVASLLRHIESEPDDYFLSCGKKIVEPRTLQYRFKSYLKEAGLRDYNFHALRHTFATRWMERGFDVKALSCILGHADVSTTLNIYVHPSMDTMRGFADRL